MSFFVALVDSIASHIISDWFPSFITCIFLDTAFCNKTERRFYLDILSKARLSAEETSFCVEKSKIVSGQFSTVHFFNWVCDRDVQFKNVNFDLVNMIPEGLSLLLFGIYPDQIERLQFNGTAQVGKLPQLLNFISSCSKLTGLNVNFLTSEIFMRLDCKSLKYIETKSIDKSVMTYIAKNCTVLRTLAISQRTDIGCMNLDVFFTLLHHNPSLTSVSLPISGAGDFPTIPTVLTSSCRLLIDVELQFLEDLLFGTFDRFLCLFGSNLMIKRFKITAHNDTKRLIYESASSFSHILPFLKPRASGRQLTMYGFMIQNQSIINFCENRPNVRFIRATDLDISYDSAVIDAIVNAYSTSLVRLYLLSSRGTNKLTIKDIKNLSTHCAHLYDLMVDENVGGGVTNDACKTIDSGFKAVKLIPPLQEN